MKHPSNYLVTASQAASWPGPKSSWLQDSLQQSLCQQYHHNHHFLPWPFPVEDVSWVALEIISGSSPLLSLKFLKNVYKVTSTIHLVWTSTGRWQQQQEHRLVRQTLRSRFVLYYCTLDQLYRAYTTVQIELNFDSRKR